MSTPPSSYGYGERPPLQGFRRSFTAPHRKLSYHERAALDPSDADASVWYRHPSARIVHFSPPTDSISNSTSMILPETDYPVDTVETLPWSSTGETTLAMGELKIEKVQGSTNFIKCGNVNQALLRNSQSWCVDGVSRFVLRVRKLQYYRIELPDNSTEQKAKAEELNEVLKRIIKHEATPCPFRRGFHVELPASAITPRRRGTWKKKEASPATPMSEGSQLPRLRSSRLWSKRAVSDGKAPTQAVDAEQIRPDSAESPLARRSHLPIMDGSSLRSKTPSSAASSENLRTPPTTGYKSEELNSNQDENLSEDSESPEKGANVPVHREHNLDETNEDDDPASVLSSDVPDQQDMDSTHMLQNPAVDDDIPNRTVRLWQDDEDPAIRKKKLPDQAPFESDDGGDELNDVGTPLEEPTSSTSPRRADEQISSVVDHLEDAEVGSDMHMDGTVEALSKLAVTNSDSSSPAKTMEQQVQSTTTREGQDDVASPTVSTSDSFHTVDDGDDSDTRITPSPVLEGQQTPMTEPAGLVATTDHQHERHTSQLTVTADHVQSVPLDTAMDESNFSPGKERLSTPPLTESALSESSWADVPTPLTPSAEQSLRHRLRSHGSMSPLPSPSTVFIPAQHQSQGNHLTAAILQKAATVALVKPIEVVVLIFHILAKIASGATVDDLLSGELFRRPDQPHRRTTSATLPDQLHTQRGDSSSQEDEEFGMHVRNRHASSFCANPQAEAKNVGETDSLLEID